MSLEIQSVLEFRRRTPCRRVHGEASSSSGDLFVRFFTAFLLLIASSYVHAQTPDDITKLIERLLELDSIDLAKDVKFRPGIVPSLHELDADESTMKALGDPYDIHGRNEPGAGGWYRIRFKVPEKLGKIPV